MRPKLDFKINGQGKELKYFPLFFFFLVSTLFIIPFSLASPFGYDVDLGTGGGTGGGVINNNNTIINNNTFINLTLGSFNVTYDALNSTYGMYWYNMSDGS